MVLGAAGGGSRPSRRVINLLSSTGVNTLVGVIGLATPLIAYALEREIIKDAALGASMIIIVGLVVKAQYLRSAGVTLRRAHAEEMADPLFFKEVEAAILERSIHHVDELADGYVTIYSSEVPLMSVLLYRVLAESKRANRRVRATDLTTNPDVLMSRLDYLAANRHLVKSGGSIERVFICYRQKLLDETFARNLVKLISQHRSLGVVCGIAVRDLLRAEDAMDAVVFDRAAVLVESEQANIEYTTGWSTIHFKRVETWIGRFDRVWQQNETPSATALLADYESAVRPMLTANTWDGARVTEALGG